MEVGVRDLRNHLSQFLERVKDGEELVVTDRGKAIARIVAVDGERRIDTLVREGVVTPASTRKRSLPKGDIVPRGSVSDLVEQQRR